MRCLGLFTLFVAVISSSIAFGQDPESAPELTTIRNADFESEDSGRPSNWVFSKQPNKDQQFLSIDDATEGERAAELNCLEGKNKFTNMMQVIDASGYQGKRVRFRASVKVKERKAGSKVQLWFRVDRKNGMGAFDNMDNRPIKDTEWTPHEIVLDVAEDATKLNVGMFVLGSASAMVDDASLEIVADDVETTDMIAEGSQQTPSFMNARFREAVGEADNAPKQPFFNHWLWLPLVGAGLCLLAYWKPENRNLEDVYADDPVESLPVMRELPKFALRFSVVYWVLYLFPFGFIEYYLPIKLSEATVRFTAKNFLGIREELVLPNGSGDTTFSYVQVLI